MLEEAKFFGLTSLMEQLEEMIDVSHTGCNITIGLEFPGIGIKRFDNEHERQVIRY